ncbi:V-type proton ATPase subunit S1 [Platysternon megacephalum]|uniref:V-type proton ATPase subunit S1 n=1 Tax=Platysternon megacephalum TaxID=55544 RepID=A0A4D9DMA7_9SAUR|nr:V-type proton ATPase subunit S1 [Platysternon megacephalum]
MIMKGAAFSYKHESLDLMAQERRWMICSCHHVLCEALTALSNIPCVYSSCDTQICCFYEKIPTDAQLQLHFLAGLLCAHLPGLRGSQNETALENLIFEKGTSSTYQRSSEVRGLSFFCRSLWDDLYLPQHFPMPTTRPYPSVMIPVLSGKIPDLELGTRQVKVKF